MSYVDAYGVKRWRVIEECGDQAVKCGWKGHRWDDSPPVKRRGYGGDVEEIRLTCDCGRERVDVCHPQTFALLSRSYAGGEGPAPGAAADRAGFRAEDMRRRRMQATNVSTIFRDAQ